jgi:uncharacterized protein YecA (UPF0149 family)
MPQRNAPCICGSGKKYKKCCLEKMGVHTSYSHNDLKMMEAVMQAQDQVMKSEEENNDNKTTDTQNAETSSAPAP